MLDKGWGTGWWGSCHCSLQTTGEILNSSADPEFFKSQTPHHLPTPGQNESCVALVPRDESKCFLKQKEGISFA